MRRFTFPLLLLLMLILSGCKVGQRADSNRATAPVKTPYSSDTSTEDCYLCGGGIENLIPSCWGQNNIALISLNTFEIKPLEINHYDRINGRLIEKYAGAVSFGGSGSKDGGFAASLLQNYDRGYTTGHVDFFDDEVLDISKAAGFLCEDCLNNILPSQIDSCFGVGAINLATKEVRIFEEHLRGFGLGDFYIDCDTFSQCTTLGSKNQAKSEKYCLTTTKGCDILPIKTAYSGVNREKAQYMNNIKLLKARNSRRRLVYKNSVSAAIRGRADDV